MTEVDYVSLENVYSLTPASVLQSLSWKTRVLPVQVLGRKATSTAFKFRALLRSIHLETGNVDLLLRCGGEIPAGQRGQRFAFA